jgi:sortase A
VTKVVVALAALLAVLALPASVGAEGTADAPTGTLVTTGRLVVDTLATNAGTARVVKLEGWPKGPVTISLCGNEARRASADCDLATSFAAVVPETGNVVAILPAATPPVGCPCVVRVTTNGNDFVRAVPIDLPGVPVVTPEQRPPALGAVPSAQLVVVTDLVQDPDASVGDRVLALFGGPVRRILVLTVRNAGTLPMRNLSVTGAIGASPSSGASIALPPIGVLEPGEERTHRVPVTIAAPAVGTFVAHGTVFGTESPVAFETATESRPWGLAALAMVAFVIVVRRIVRKRRRRRANTDLRPETGQPASACDTPRGRARTPGDVAERPGNCG